MNRSTLLLLTAALATALLAPTLPPAQAQSTGTDLELANVTVENATFDAEEPTNVTATIVNHGPSSASGVVHFRYEQENRTLTGDGRSDQPFNTTQPLGPGESVRITIRWSPSEEQIGAGTVLAYLTSPQDDTGGNNRASTAAFVEHYELNATLVDGDEHRTLPGRTTGYRVRLENAGNAPLTVGSGVAEEPGRGWSFEAPEVPASLDPGENTTALALVTPPDVDEGSLPNGANQSATMRWWAEENPRGNVTVRLPNTTVERDPDPAYDYGADVEIARPTVAVNPVAVSELRLEVTNTGNVFDVYDLTSSLSGPLAGNLTVDFLGRDLLVLGPQETGSVVLQVSLEGDPPTHHGANLTLEASTVNAAIEPGATDADSADVHVAAPDLRVGGVSVPAAVYQDGGSVGVAVNVSNSGEGPAPSTRLSMEALRGGFAFAQAQASSPRLGPGQAEQVKVSIPVRSLSGSYDLEVALDVSSAVNESDESNNGGRGDLFVRTAGLTVQPATGIEALPGQFVRYERPPHVFTVRNEGNARERVTAEVTSENGWIGDTLTVDVPAGGRRPLPFSFVVPDRPGTENDRVTVDVHLDNRTQVRDANATSTTIVDKTAPQLLDVDLPANVTATEPFHVRTEWRDAVGVDRAWMELTSEGASTRSVNLTRTTEGVFEASATVFELGTYEVRFRAVDASSARNAFSQQTPLTLNATYERAPQVTFQDPPSQRVVKTGDSIPVDVTDAAGVTSVRYEAAGGGGELSEPYGVPTDGWTTGERIVTVSATNRYGLTGTANATYLVDNEPPGIDEVTTSPSEPEAGERVDVTVDTSGNATQVLLEVWDASGAAIAEHDLTRDGDRFRGSFAFPSGGDEFVFVASDLAGNEATHTRAADADRSGIPLPGSPLFLGLLAAAALLLRRRR